MGKFELEFAARLATARAQQSMLSDPDLVALAVASLAVSSDTGSVSAEDRRLYRELEELARYIQDSKREIANLQPDTIGGRDIPIATDELDAVIGATEDATNRIMDSCDEISALAGRCDADVGVAVTGAVTRIFEACNFQDITGQRITKVVRTLRHIERKIDLLVAILGEEVERITTLTAEGPEPVGEAALLNGPQMAAVAIDQNEIDRLMSGTD
ncbi:MAG: protein phosphatase CheZ [Azospirillaceae bacterium]|nr:protein phosphatase CheZ [Azospirillaceae bacterium]